jgi:tetratricopeptide (TPR) repeat protein
MKKMNVFVFVAAITCSLTTWSQESLQSDTLIAKLGNARELLMQGKKAELSELCLKIMQSHPNNKSAVQWWVITNMERSPEGEQKMLPRLDSLSQIFPSNTAIMFFKSFILAEYGKNEESLVIAEKLILLQPDSAVNYVGKGQVLYELQRYNEALEAFNRAISLEPKRYDLYGMKASVLSKMGKYDEAVITMDEGINVNPGFATNYYNRACFNCLKGNKKQALTDLGKAISMNPRFKQSAAQDEDFKSLYEEEEFKTIIK